MTSPRRIWFLCVPLVFAAYSIAPYSIQAQPFTFQGIVSDDTETPLDGVYDIRFRLYSTEVGGAAIGTVIENDLTIEDGLVQAELDFGPEFSGSEERWLQIGFRDGTATGSYEDLLDRTQIAYAPRSISSLSTDSVSSIEMFDEAGIVSIEESFDTPGPTIRVLASDTLEAPGPGFALVMGGLSAQIQGSANDEVIIGISTSETSFSADSSIVRPTLYAPLSLHEVFTIPAAGTYRYFFLGRKATLGQTALVTNMRLTALFVPTAYGTVQSE